ATVVDLGRAAPAVGEVVHHADPRHERSRPRHQLDLPVAQRVHAHPAVVEGAAEGCLAIVGDVVALGEPGRAHEGAPARHGVAGPHHRLQLAAGPHEVALRGPDAGGLRQVAGEEHVTLVVDQSAPGEAEETSSGGGVAAVSHRYDLPAAGTQIGT